MKYEYINFLLTEKKTKTNVYECKNNKTSDLLGVVKWHTAWRRYCYFPSCPAVYSSGCLQDICSFINDLMKNRKTKNNECFSL